MKQDRKYELIIYPDDPNSSEYLDKAKCLFEQWAYILHDSDILSDGSPKKAHIHFEGRLPLEKKLTPSGVSYQIGIPVEAIQYIRDFKAAIRYLCHIDDDTKYQYPIDNIVSNFDVSPLFITKPTEEQQIKPILEYIMDNPTTNVKQLSFWVLENHYWSAFRRNYSFLKDFIQYNRSDFEYGNCRS